ncbi:TIGR04086 family membrane protein [Ruminococcaceae bacterium OttesenSCG-928-L11]|nr:TIGR04086 family membrane protein [Ruminococcaceae bacterium OttesenSCG-928-L11]
MAERGQRIHRSQRGQSPDEGGGGFSIRPVAFSVLAGVIVCALLMLAMSAVVASRNIPQSAIDPMALAALTLGAFAAGYLCAKLVGSNGLIYGAVCGAILTAIVVLAGMVSGAGGMGVPAVFKAIFIMLAAMLGGVLRVNTKRRR